MPAGQRLGLGDLHGNEPCGAPTALAVGQSRQPAVGEAGAPDPRGVYVQPGLAGDACTGAPAGSVRHDGGALRGLVLGLGP
jgi:hypothetical protein